jgi:nicotinate-nucleotide adenylyltransferase
MQPLAAQPSQHHSYNPSMRIGYFGGSFDPPHRGHLAVARAAARAFALDTILFVPTSHQPLKPAGPLAPYADRLAMVTLLCELEDAPAARFEPSTLEAPLPGDAPHYTVDTLQHLRATLSPADELFVLLGADAFLDLPQWRSPERLLTLADWIIVSRPGFDLTRLDALALTPAQRARTHLLPTLADPTSASSLRRQLAVGAPDATLLEGLPRPILTYIQHHHLYSL